MPTGPLVKIGKDPPVNDKCGLWESSTQQPDPQEAPRWYKRLVQPSRALPQSLHRRVHLLAWLLLFLLVLTFGALVLVLALELADDVPRAGYVALVGSLFILFALGYVLNRLGRYYCAAGVAVLGSVLAPWLSLAIDPAVLAGDPVPLAYVAISVLLASILLPLYGAVAVAGVQLAALAFVPSLTESAAAINWASFLTFLVFISVLSILVNLLSQRDLAQIDRQARLLAQSAHDLREQSIHDYLTRLFNRRYLEETLAREIQRAERGGHTIGVIMLDIDHFKRVNDTQGHAAGDAVLQALGTLLRDSVRPGDIACRYGGEEFVLVLPEAPLEIARARAEQLREKVTHMRVEHGGRVLDPVTISLGVAAYPRHGSNGDRVLETADAALYEAKERGRNQVVVAA